MIEKEVWNGRVDTARRVCGYGGAEKEEKRVEEKVNNDNWRK